MVTPAPAFPYHLYGLRHLHHLVAAGLYGLEDPVDVEVSSGTGRIHSAGTGPCTYTEEEPAERTTTTLSVREVLTRTGRVLPGGPVLCSCASDTSDPASPHATRLQFLTWAAPGQRELTGRGDPSSLQGIRAQIADLRQMAMVGSALPPSTARDPLDRVADKVRAGLDREADRLTGTPGYRATRARRIVDGAQLWLYLAEHRAPAHAQHALLCALSDGVDVGVTMAQVRAVSGDVPGRVRLAAQVTDRAVWLYVRVTRSIGLTDLAPLVWAEALTHTEHGVLVRMPLALAYTLPVAAYEVGFLDEGYDTETVRAAARLAGPRDQLAVTVAALAAARS